MEPAEQALHKKIPAQEHPFIMDVFLSGFYLCDSY